MKKLLASAAVVSLLAAAAPLAAAALDGDGAEARLADGLASSLASAAPDDRLLVFVHGVTRADALGAVEASGALRVGEFQSIGVPVVAATAAQIDALSSAPGVTYIEHNRAISRFLDTSRKAIRADEATATTFAVTSGKNKKETTTTYGPFDGGGQSIAIVDEGVDGTHPMFTRPDGSSKVVRNLKVACLNNVPGVVFSSANPQTCPEFVTGDGADNEPFIVDMTDRGNDTDTISIGGHGTHVAGIAAGVQVTTDEDAPRTFSGVAPGADVVALSMGMGVGIYAGDAALDWVARHHADPCGDQTCPPITVVNNSWGSGGDWDPESATTKIQRRLIADGVTMVWANGNGDTLGNGGDGSDNRSGSDASAQIPGVVAVANYDDADSGTRDGSLASSSSRGKSGALTTYPDVSAPGTAITSACRPYLPICQGIASADPNYGTIGGTSMAAPHVAGAVAVIQQAALAKLGHRLTAAEVENLLEDTAHPFTFGAGYEEDPSNPDGTTSFDKGHGLVDVMRAVESVLGLPPSTPPPGGESQCTDTDSGYTATDAEGEDQPYAVSVVTGPYDPAVDLTAVALDVDTAAQTIVVLLTVADLGDGPPAGGDGIYAASTLTIDDVAHAIVAQRDATGFEAFTADDTPVTGAFDPAADTIRIEVPRDALDPASAGVEHTSLSVQIGRTAGVLVLWSDDGGGCSGEVDLGGGDVPPDGSAGPGSPYTWSGEPTTSVSDVFGLGLNVTPTGEQEDQRRIDVNVPAGGTITFALTCDNPAYDFDITLTGPDGAPAGTGTGPGESADFGCEETITVEDATPGVYTATVIAFTTVEGTYEGSVTVS